MKAKNSKLPLQLDIWGGVSYCLGVDESMPVADTYRRVSKKQLKREVESKRKQLFNG